MDPDPWILSVAFFFSTLMYCFNCRLLSLHVSTVNHVAVTHKSVIIHLIYTHPLPWNLITSWMFASPVYLSVESYEASSTGWTHVQWCKHGPYIFAQPSTFILCKEIWKKTMPAVRIAQKKKTLTFPSVILILML